VEVTLATFGTVSEGITVLTETSEETGFLQEQETSAQETEGQVRNNLPPLKISAEGFSAMKRRKEAAVF
jgi:hypothetical protein